MHKYKSFFDQLDQRPRKMIRVGIDYTRLEKASFSQGFQLGIVASMYLRDKTLKIQRLPHKNLTIPLNAIIEPDDDGFIVRATDLPLYGFGNDPIEAVEMLKQEIESLYDDLMEDDEFTEEWLQIKQFLRERIVN